MKDLLFRNLTTRYASLVKEHHPGQILMGKPSRINDVKLTPVSRKINRINELGENGDADKPAESMT